MSRAKEIIRRLKESTRDESNESVVTIDKSITLWPRFEKVHEAVVNSLANKPTSGIYREFNTFSWSGYDAGIHDHTGNVEGNINGIELEFKISGTTIDNQPHMKQQYLAISGTFTSLDGLKGVLQMLLENDKLSYEAYWLQVHNGFLRLEQVVSPEGLIFDANKLNPQKENVAVPGTRIVLNRFLR